jgi:hypothetical protein
MLPTQREGDAPELALALVVVLVLEAVDAEAGVVLDADAVDDAESVTTFVDEPQPDSATAAISTPRARVALMPLLSL